MLYTPLYTKPAPTEQLLQDAKNKLAQAKREYKKCLDRFNQLDNDYNSFYSGYTLFGFSIESFIPIIGILRYFDYKTLAELRSKYMEDLILHKESIQSARKELHNIYPNYIDSEDDEACNCNSDCLRTRINKT